MKRRILVTGSRKWENWQLMGVALSGVYKELEGTGPKPYLIQGGALGADKLAYWWARSNKIPNEPAYKADWEGPCAPECQSNHRRPSKRDPHITYCPTAGHRRNQEMVDLGPVLVCAFQVAGSTGTQDCIDRALAAGIEVRRWVSPGTATPEILR